jgi:mono/diheme cytochrome c family protein
MLRNTMIAASVAVALSALAVAQADEPVVPLKDAPGHEVVEGNCAACHSLDYIRTNSPFMTAKVWEAEVTKMINAFGAPIDSADAKTITDYLARNYGSP